MDGSSGVVFATKVIEPENKVLKLISLFNSIHGMKTKNEAWKKHKDDPGKI